MDTRLKQRLIGAIVMTAIAIIILPMLFDGSAEHRASVEAAIPSAPQISINSLSVAQTEAKMDEMVAASTELLPEPKPDSIENVDEVANFALNDSGLPVGWSLRLGSFKEEQNAIRLRQSLRDKDYRSYILTGDPKEDDLFRVYVGPMLDKDKLQRTREEIAAEFNLPGQIVRYRMADDRYQLGG